MATAVLWFRRDLRIHDNPALNWALKNAHNILPVYIHSEEDESPWSPGGASRWWLHHSLQALDNTLRQHKLKLHYFRGNTDEILSSIISTSSADALVFNRLYDPHLAARDEALLQKYSHSIFVKSFDSGTLFPPGSILNNQQKPYRVYTPFYKKCNSMLPAMYGCYQIPSVSNDLNKLQLHRTSFKDSLDSLKLLDPVNWHDKLGNYWSPGEDHALNQLESFIDNSIDHYSQQRDIPSIDATSRLSASLHFGEITPQQVLLALQPLLHESHNEHARLSHQTFIKQLIWREFAQHILWHFPYTATEPMDQRYTSAFWKSDTEILQRWKSGNTGIPVIDAGMKQLWETGWMHNRVRMIVSSYLTKNLGINWLDGAKWFWDTLVDADLANNSMGWQWVAGCGVDAAPYYRIFNPLTQAERFDKDGKYVRSWTRSNTDRQVNTTSVDLKQSREDALERYQKYIKR